MSRAELAAEALRVPAAPRLVGALREALSDFYFNSWRLVPANAVWGLGVLLVLLAVSTAPILFLVLVPLLAFPVVGLFRMGALIARGESVALSDAFGAWRRYLAPTLVAGIVSTAATIALVINVVFGATSDSFLGWTIAALAGWGLLALWTGMLCFWPLLVDPARADATLRERVRLAAVLPIAFPLRLGLMTVIIGVVMAVSTVLFAALLTIALAYSALVACRYVLPVADRLEGRATELVPE
ncbi:MAG: hypothetical protein H0X16_04040 [Chloroflexi bacterium]|nr:hypothetical protein [Chloroflexota bacterium]